MRNRLLIQTRFILPLAIALGGCSLMQSSFEKSDGQPAFVLRSNSLAPVAAGADAQALKLDGLFFETAQGRTPLPPDLAVRVRGGRTDASVTMPGGRVVTVSVKTGKQNSVIRLHAKPDTDIIRWGLAVEAATNEYFTGLMERVVDGPQSASWAVGRKEAMDLRGQKVEMILKPTTSVYAPFYLSSRGYAVFVKGDWPGLVDFCVDNPHRVKIEFEGPTFEMTVYTSGDPAALVRAHAMEAGPPFVPPRWMYTPWRWRNEHHQRTNYYDGTLVRGPFNSEFMEDVLMMKAYGIPCGVYWIDRPWGPGPLGYDDFEIDTNRLPHFAESVTWINERDMEMVMWIGPFFQGKMMEEALAKKYNLAGQRRPPNGNNYPLVDFTNPEARAYWQAGVGKLLKLGVAGFKLDRGEESIPSTEPYKTFDGRTIRENRNAYSPLYLKATYDVARRYRGLDFVCMPRAAYTGSARYGVFWGGDIGSTQEGLRASIIAVQRSAVMGYPNWGSDTGGYTGGTMDQELNARWLGFSCFTPIMEVGPTRDVGYWNLARELAYDAELIAIWRLYARLHQRLVDYSHRCGLEANRTGMPIVRPLFLVDPKTPQAWSNWWTYLYGPDLLVSPIWEKGKRTQEVYLPTGSRWRDAWNPARVYPGGQTVTVTAEMHQIPLFIRAGSTVDPGDLNREYRESVAIAKNRPDLKRLDAEVKTWFEKHRRRK